MRLRRRWRRRGTHDGLLAALFLLACESTLLDLIVFEAGQVSARVIGCDVLGVAFEVAGDGFDEVADRLEHISDIGGW